jgi:hypothetical protein
MPITNHHRPRHGPITIIWEAFGLCPPDPTRRTRDPDNRDPHVRPSERAYPLGDIDCLDPTTNITHVSIRLPDGSVIRAYGDDTTGTTIHVYGITEDAVVDTYRRIERAVPLILDTIWRRP